MYVHVIDLNLNIVLWIFISKIVHFYNFLIVTGLGLQKFNTHQSSYQ